MMTLPESSLSQLERRIRSMESGEPLAQPILPNIIDFVLGEDFLDRPGLYPRQATLLKTIFQADDLFTNYDRHILEKWGAGNSEGLEHNRRNGVPSDLLERIAINQAGGRPWFREVVFVGGRRCGKGYIGSLSIAYVIWNYIASGNPQDHFGIASSRTLTIPVFAQSGEQARDVFWADLVGVITEAPCFRPYIAVRRAERLLLWSPSQLAVSVDRRGSPAIEIVASESTESAARGYAAPALIMDEMAHDIAAGPRSADLIYNAASHMQTQFRTEAFSYFPSSPRTMSGQFFALYQRALTYDSQGSALYPETLPLQFTSWDLYEDWDQPIPLDPDGITSKPLLRPIISEDDQEVRRLRQSDPVTFRSEVLGHWSEVEMAFFIREAVLDMVEPFDGRTLEMKYSGSRRERYFCHVDLSATRDNTALVIAHPEGGSDPTSVHLVVDLVEYWSPSRFENGEVNMSSLLTMFKRRLEDFPTLELWTFDSFESTGFIQELRDHAASLGRRTQFEKFVPSRQRSREIAEILRVLINERRIHAPCHQLMIDELLFLQDLGDRVDHPTTGPVTSNDIYTCLAGVTAGIEESVYDPRRKFAGLRLHATRWPGVGADGDVFDALSDFGAGRVPVYPKLRGGKTTQEYRSGRRWPKTRS